ncbi:MAG: hypothetical protein MNPFHGCM_01519 [Gemmatimonadaceae bacterium]|nr:hypothetical protein [Gemmatimonadaceae bacterium]
MPVLNQPLLWGLPQAAALPDTIVTRTIVERAWLDTLVSVEQAIVGLAMLGMLLTIVLVLVAIRKTLQELSRLVQTSIGDVSGAMHSVRDVADDVRGITRTLRSDFETVSETVRDVNDRVRDVVEDAEERVRRFGALVDSVQSEAEDLVETATDTLHGVRDGATALRHGFSFARWATSDRKRRPRAEAESDEDLDEAPRRTRKRPRFRPIVRPKPRRE